MKAHHSGVHHALDPEYMDRTFYELIDIIRGGLIRDGHVQLYQFGTFKLKWIKQRSKRDKKSGRRVTPTPKPKVVFSPAKALRELIEPAPEPVIPLPPFAKVQKPILRVEEKRQQLLLCPVEETADDTPPSHEGLLDQPVPAAYQAGSDWSGQQPLNGDGSAQSAMSHAPAGRGYHKRMTGAALLALVPVIIITLQNQFAEHPAGGQINSTPAVSQTTRSDDGNGADNQPLNGFTTINRPNSQPGTPDQPPPAEVQAGVQMNDQITAAAEAQAGVQVDSSADEELLPFYQKPGVHKVNQGDNLWALAGKYFNDPFLWPLIYRANIRNLQNPDHLNVGQQLIIPGLQHSPEYFSAVDRSHVAEGYFLLYEYYKDSSDYAHYFLVGAQRYSPEWLEQQKRQIDKKHWKALKSGQSTLAANH